MSKSEMFDLVEREGLLGLYRAGLFNPFTCEYEGTVVQLYWEQAGLCPLKCFRSEI